MLVVRVGMRRCEW